MSDEKFLAGDTVKHVPTGETWTLACDQCGSHVAWLGWPEGMALAEDCKLERRATPERREHILRSWASKEGNDFRIGWAKSDLTKEGGIR